MAASDYVQVPFAPRPPPLEFVPPRPSSEAVWVDGSWVWLGNRYGWKYGSWVVAPPGVRHARWVLVRRSSDGQLFFAPSAWKDASGEVIERPSFETALGPRARARSQLGDPPRRPDARDRVAPRPRVPARTEDDFGEGED
ncbi:MAG TPA: hypothetical protein VM580_15255 [Labilithrix sp.]|nr:hypothetical protein [Labilithrix sp.]